MRKIVHAVLFCFILSGCVLGSANPFFTPDLVVEMPELYGNWFYEKDIKSDNKAPVVISSGKITIFDDKGIPGEAKLTFFKVEQVLFVDFFPDEGEFKKELFEDKSPLHFICLIKYENGKLLFNPLDYAWLGKEVEAGRIPMPYQKAGTDEDVDIILTASSAQWIEFLKAHRNDPKAFPEDDAWLIRKPVDDKKVP